MIKEQGNVDVARMFEWDTTGRKEVWNNSESTKKVELLESSQRLSAGWIVSGNTIYNITDNRNVLFIDTPIVSDEEKEPVFDGMIEEVSMPDNVAETKIEELIKEKPGLDYLDIADELRINIDTVFRLCDILIKENKIKMG